MIRVSTIADKPITIDGFKNIKVIMKSHSVWWELSPYYLKTEEGCLMENVWQFSKVYESTPERKEYYSRFDNTVIWNSYAETHVIDDTIQPQYFEWHSRGLNNSMAVRYPCGYSNKHKALFSITPRIIEFSNADPNIRYNYIEARKAIYLPLYCHLVRQQPRFQQLKKMLEKGLNLNIIEIDGPREESLDYYKENYGVDNTFIEQRSTLVTTENMKIYLNDKKHSFGHGYCLGLALLDLDQKVI